VEKQQSQSIKDPFKDRDHIIESLKPLGSLASLIGKEGVKKLVQKAICDEIHNYYLNNEDKDLTNAELEILFFEFIKIPGPA
jgi:hypothetical protein